MNLLQATFNRGVQQGIEQGVQLEKIKMARNLIRAGIELPIISRAVRLSLDTLETLEKEERQH